MPDEAQQTTEPDPQPSPRRTAMQVAQDAQATAEAALSAATAVESAQDNLANELGSVSEKVTDISQRLTDRETAHAELRDELMGRLSGARSGDAPSRDQVDGRIAEALQPIEESLSELSARVGGLRSGHPTFEQMNGRIGEALMPVASDVERLNREAEAFREEMGGYQGAVNRKLDDHRQRLAALEEHAKGAESNPAADTLAEDFMADQVERLVRQRLDGLLARVEELERRQRDAPAVAELTADAPTGTLAQARVLKLMRMVTSLGKDRQTDSGPKFSFRSIDDAMDAVGNAMREVGLIGSPKIRQVEYETNQATNNSGNSVLWTTARLVLSYTFTAPEDGSTHTIEMAGEGRDNSDKSTSKAGSMAMKYALLHGLMIPVTGMPDGDAEHPQVQSAPQRTAQPDQAPPGPPADSPEVRAGKALTAIQNIHVHPRHEQYDRLVAIGNQVHREGLLNRVVEHKGEQATLKAWLDAALAMLRAGDEAADPAPPEYY